MDGLLDAVNALVGFCLVSALDESSYNVYGDSSKDDEDKELDEIVIYICAIWTSYFFFACSIAAFTAC